MADLIIGAASNYDWKQLQNYVNSLNTCGTKAKKVLVVSNMKAETIERLKAEGIMLISIGTYDDLGNLRTQVHGAPHVQRFLELGMAVEQMKKNGMTFSKFVMTDTRDVIFQADPFALGYLDEENFLCTKEGLRYKDEPWGANNLYQALGKRIYDRLADDIIFNVGVIGGDFYYLDKLLELIYQLSLNRPIPVVDQAVYNYIMRYDLMNVNPCGIDNTLPFAVNLGTTLEAVLAGSGDIGLLAQMKPETIDEYKKNFLDIQPIIEYYGETDFVVRTPSMIDYATHKYAIVHQYDRIPKLKEYVDRKYGSP